MKFTKRILFLIFIAFSCQLSFAQENNQFQEWKWGAPLIYPDPFFGGYTTDLSDVSVDLQRLVVGVEAKDLTVNGSPATAVEFREPNYRFTGFKGPDFGKVEIILNPGQIKDEKTGIPFNGVTVTRFLFDPKADDDRDGLSNSEEINQEHSDPTKEDTDNDGMPDAYEVKSSCLSPFKDESLPHNDYGTWHHGTPDLDSDGISNLNEFKQGTDPCVANKI